MARLDRFGPSCAFPAKRSKRVSLSVLQEFSSGENWWSPDIRHPKNCLQIFLNDPPTPPPHPQSTHPQPTPPQPPQPPPPPLPHHTCCFPSFVSVPRPPRPGNAQVQHQERVFDLLRGRRALQVWPGGTVTRWLEESSFFVFGTHGGFETVWLKSSAWYGGGGLERAVV